MKGKLIAIATLVSLLAPAGAATAATALDPHFEDHLCLMSSPVVRTPTQVVMLYGAMAYCSVMNVSGEAAEYSFTTACRVATCDLGMPFNWGVSVASPAVLLP